MKHWRETTAIVSGVGLETDVGEVALQVLRSGSLRLLHYETGSDDETVWGRPSALHLRAKQGGIHDA